MTEPEIKALFPFFPPPRGMLSKIRKAVKLGAKPEDFAWLAKEQWRLKATQDFILKFKESGALETEASSRQCYERLEQDLEKHDRETFRQIVALMKPQDLCRAAARYRANGDIKMAKRLEKLASGK